MSKILLVDKVSDGKDALLASLLHHAKDASRPHHILPQLLSLLQMSSMTLINQEDKLGGDVLASSIITKDL